MAWSANETALVFASTHMAVLVDVHRGARIIQEFIKRPLADGTLTPKLRWPSGITIGMPATNPFPDAPDVVAVGVGRHRHLPSRLYERQVLSLLASRTEFSAAR